MGNEFLCELCRKTFANRKYLTQHNRRNHSPATLQLQCHNCKYSTRFKNALQRHVVRHIKPQSNQAVHICVLCRSFECHAREEMIQHYEYAHEVQLNKKFLVFEKSEDFETWKSGIERADVCRFIFSNGSKERKGVNVRYYRCFRDGIYHSEGEGKRRLKAKGSIKMGGICPASIKAVTEKETGAINVTFIPNHVGHGEDLGRLNLSKAERAEIATKLSQNIPSQVILDQIGTSMPDELQRIHLITGKDIANIQASLKLEKRDGSLLANSHTSIEAWISLMEKETDIVRFYKPRGAVFPSHPQLLEDDMLLIIASDAQLEMLKKHGANCISFDGTYVSRQNEFKLTTVLVLDERRQGFPCLFIFSNRCDSEVMSVCVRALQAEVGSIRAKVFMTDMSQIHIDGWRCCMPEPENVWFCSWQVDGAWRESLRQVKGAEKKKEVYQTVRKLMEEIDESEFIRLMRKAVRKFKSDPSTSTFGDYFDKNFSGNAERWAFCYRKHCGLSTNTHLENMHKVLKYIYLDGKKVKRLDKTISTLLRMVRDKFHGQLIVRMTSVLTSKIATTRKRHEASIGMQCTVLPCAEGWLVTSKSEFDMFLVRKLANSSCDCDLKCDDCSICIHDFTCDCVDSMVKLNMCKHIHRVASCLAVDRESTDDDVEFINLVVSSDGKHTIEEDIGVESKKDAVWGKDFIVKIGQIRERYEEILENLQTDEHADVLWNTLVYSTWGYQPIL